MSFPRTKRFWLGLGLGLVLASGVGAAVAAIPDSSGAIHACYKVDKDGSVAGDGQLRLIDPAPTKKEVSACKSGEAQLDWNAQGTRGPTGARGERPEGRDGPKGATGANGAPGARGARGKARAGANGNARGKGSDWPDRAHKVRLTYLPSVRSRQRSWCEARSSPARPQPRAGASPPAPGSS